MPRSVVQSQRCFFTATTDWSDEKHDYCLCPADGGDVEHGIVLHDPVHLHGWIRQLRERYRTISPFTFRNRVD